MKQLITVLLVVIIFALTAVTIEVYRYSLRDETRVVDAAIVLGAAVYGERPSPVFRERINHAIRLYQDGYVEALIFTGGVGRRDVLSEAEVGRNYALAQGIPANAIFIETSSTSTLENLANAQAVATENGFNRFLIVSTPFHMRRAMSLADDLQMEAYTSPTRTTRWISWFTLSFSFSREVVAYLVYLVY